MNQYGPSPFGTASDGGPTSYAGTTLPPAGQQSSAWTNPGNAAGASDSNYASNSINFYSDYLVLTNAGLAVPAGETVVGVQATFRTYSGYTSQHWWKCFLVIGGVVQSSGKSVTPSPDMNAFFGSFGVATAGSSSELWGASPTPAIVNAANFGVAVSLYNGSKGIVADRIESGTMTVWTTGGASGGALPGRFLVVRPPFVDPRLV